MAVWPGMWPVKEELDESNNLPQDTTGAKNGEKERQDLILKEQWGESLVSKDDGKDTSKNATTTPSSTLNSSNSNLQGRKFNYFDGASLAYYLTTERQFIDPNNRRDLTREELMALDEYMKVWGLGNAGVVQAYGV